MTELQGRQAALVDAVTHRLTVGPSLNEWDALALGWLATVVGVGPSAARAVIELDDEGA